MLLRKGSPQLKGRRWHSAVLPRCRAPRLPCSLLPLPTLLPILLPTLFPTLFPPTQGPQALGSENVGGAAVTGVVEGVRHLQPAKFWVHSNRQIQAQKMHSNFCWLSLANLFFLKKNDENGVRHSISQKIFAALRQAAQHMKARKKGFHLRPVRRPNSSWLPSYCHLSGA